MINKPRRKNDVLFVLKVPPPFGGGEIEHQHIFNQLHDQFAFVLFSRKTHNKSKQGQLLLSNLVFGLWMILRVWGACLIRRPKVVFLWLPKDFPAFLRTMFLVASLRFFGMQVIGDLHGMGFGFLRRRTTRWFFRRTINWFQAIRVLSPSIGERLKDSGFVKRVFVIDNGVVAPEFQKRKKARIRQPVQLLYLGAISESKGFFRVLQLAKDLYRLNIRFSLNVVGEWTSSAFRQQAFDYISNNRLMPYVQFLGVKLDDDRWRVIKQSHLLLHFTDWDGQPLTIIEAMAAGVPTISTPVGAIPEMIEHNVDGFLIDRIDQSISIISELLADRMDYDAISTTARRTFERRFTVEKYADKIRQLVTVI
jgi:glycosyltransferase involved in cell wall biosynthesis